MPEDPEDQDHIHSPSDASIFVFGSNLRGIHGAGAAAYARKYLGAMYGTGRGPQGRCYAIPTCFSPGRPLPLSRIETYVGVFLGYALDHLTVPFFVSRIGCGYAGYLDRDIIPFFVHAPENCLLPPSWRRGH